MLRPYCNNFFSMSRLQCILLEDKPCRPVFQVYYKEVLPPLPQGRGIDSNAKEKHTIKRADRLCSNIALQQEKGDVTQTKGSASLIFKDS